jgi:hypothetical protein
MITKNRGIFKLNVSDLFLAKDRLLHLIFPEKCRVCASELAPSDLLLCPFCTLDLDYTHFEKYTEANAVDKLFWGRVPIKLAYAHLFYRKGGSTQHILHEEIVYVCQSILNELHSTTSQLKSFIDWEKFIQGI